MNLPRHPTETPRAHAARVAYVTMGPERSLDAVAQQLHKSVTLLGRWSKRWDWVACAAEWDAAQLEEAANRAGEAYQQQVAAMRQTMTKRAQGIIGVADKLLVKVVAAIDSGEVRVSDLRVVLQAYQTAMDMDAMALGLDGVLRGQGDG